MHVHLVAIEVSIVRSCHRQVQAERGIWKHLDSVSHDRHLVERGLSIEEDIVTILEMPFNFVTNLKVYIGAIPEHRQVNLSLIVANYILSSRPLRRSIHDQ